MKKNILITGSSSHLGSLLINYFQNRYFLILHANKMKNKKIKRKIHTSNFLSRNETINFAKKIAGRNHKINVLIHLPSKRINIKNFYKYTWDEIAEQINIQVRSLHILLSELLLKNKIANNFKLIIITSDILNNINGGMLDYLSAKSILKYYSENFNREFNGKFNSYEIRPKMFNSPLLKNIPNYIIEKNIQKKNIALTVLKIIKKIIEGKTKKRVFNLN